MSLKDLSIVIKITEVTLKIMAMLLSIKSWEQNWELEFTQIRLRVAHQSAIYDKLIVFLKWVKKILMVFQNQGAEGEE